MLIWNYKRGTGELVGESTAEQDPLDESAWLVPACATTIAPPTPLEGHVVAFIDGAWAFVVDRRGETWWSSFGHPVVVQDLGDPAGLGLFEEEPADPAEPTFTLTPFSTVAAALGSTVAAESLTLGATFNLIAGFRDTDVGRFWFFFEVPVPNEYHVVGSGIRLIEGDEYGFMIETVDQTGSPYDPPVFDVQVQSR